MKNIFLTHYIRVIFLFLFGFIFLTTACQKDKPSKKKDETLFKTEDLQGNWELILLTNKNTEGKKDTIYNKKNHSLKQMYSEKILICFEKSEVLNINITLSEKGKELKEFYEEYYYRKSEVYKDGASVKYHLNGNSILFNFKAKENDLLKDELGVLDTIYNFLINQMTLRTFWANVQLVRQGGRTYLEGLSSQGDVIKLVKID